jgi:uncharacterized protein YqhQ
MKLIKKKSVGAIFFLIPIILIIGLALLLHKNDPFPSKIKNQISYVILYPDKASTGFEILKETINYNPQNKILLFNATSKSNRLVITEQSTPDQINEIPQYWSALVTKWCSISCL